MVEILVVGAGIGGLTVSRALARAGHDVTLAERHGAVSGHGAGLVLPEAAVHMLAGLGVRLGPIVHRLARLHVTGADGRSRGGATNRVAVARPELVDALVEGLDRDVELHVATAVDVIDRGRGRPRCRIDGRDRSFDVVVGADGIRSTVRRAVAPGVPLRSAGQVCWRGIVGQRLGDDATELWTRGQRVGIVPLTDGRSYVYVVRRGEDAAGGPADGPPVPAREAAAVEALAALPAHAILRHELEELDRPVWGAADVVLLGDAAHAMTPNMGLGAAMAIADAAALTAALEGGAAGVVDRYRRSRHVAVRAAQLTSRAIGTLAHSRHPTARALRRAMRLEGTA